MSIAQIRESNGTAASHKQKTTKEQANSLPKLQTPIFNLTAHQSRCILDASDPSAWDRVHKAGLSLDDMGSGFGIWIWNLKLGPGRGHPRPQSRAGFPPSFPFPHVRVPGLALSAFSSPACFSLFYRLAFNRALGCGSHIY